MNTRKIQWRESSGKNFSVAIAGDFSPREENCADVTARAEEITAAVKPFFDSADVKILQWECTITRQDTPIAKSGPNHRCYPECTAFAKALGIDTVLLANNHTGDYGDPGVRDTLEILDDLGIRHVGAGMNEAEAARPLYLECQGLRVAVINAAEYEFGIARGSHAGGNALDPVAIAAQIKEEKSRNDLVILALHGGHEHYPYPSPRMRSWFRYFADCGADMVFNCHTHCPLGYELYNGIPVVYSPGNFYFPNRPTSLPCWYIGYVPKFFLDEKGAFAMELLPYFNFKAGLKLLDEAETVQFFEYLDKISAPIADEEGLKKLFDAWCASSSYFSLLFDRKKPEDFNDPRQVASVLSVRNILTCQSHHDLVRNCAILMEHYQLAEAGKVRNVIEEAQHPPFVKL